MEETRPSLAKRALAILVLAVAGWILLKLVIGLIAGLATFIIVVVAIVAIIWALNTL
jgi:uncharacterized membrane protein YccC